MTLSMSLGMSIGPKRTLFMMLGELCGVGIVALASVVSVSTIMFKYPMIFIVLKYLGGLYLCYIGIKLWLNRGKMAMSNLECEKKYIITNKSLVVQGFITAIANPKGWAFFIALLPPFIDEQLPLIPQISILLFIILLLEFLCLNIYANGGKTLRRFLQTGENVRFINKIAGTLMIGVGLWLALE